MENEKFELILDEAQANAALEKGMLYADAFVNKNYLINLTVIRWWSLMKLKSLMNISVCIKSNALFTTLMKTPTISSSACIVPSLTFKLQVSS